jgi:hypothetical protein
VKALRQLDPGVLGLGVLSAVVIVGPVAALSIALVDRDSDDGAGALSLLFIAVILIGFAFGGHRTARTGVDLPVTHGAFVGLLGFAAVQAVVLTGSAIAGREGQVSVLALAVSALMASSAGMIGASLGVRRTTWHR